MARSQDASQRVKTLEYVYKSVPVGVVRWSLDGRLLEANDRFLTMLGITQEGLAGISWKSITPPEFHELDARAVSELLRAGSAGPYEKEYIGKDGRRVPVLMSGALTSPPDEGIAFVFDLTQVKEAQADREQLLKIMAHESERKRIARDLHDDLMQRATALTFEVASMLGNLRMSTVLRRRLEATQRDLQALSEQVRSIAHGLHANHVIKCGLAAALRGECERILEPAGVDFEVDACGCDCKFSPVVAVQLLRIAQECLSNAVRHSRTDRIVVRLKTDGSEVCLQIQDFGRGFDTDDIRSPGLGFVSIAERANLLKGRFVLTSTPGKGTGIFVTVPREASQCALALGS